MMPPWDQLQATASDEVRQTLNRLPNELRSAARALPVTYEPMPGQDLIEDGLEDDTLGLFVGGDHDEEAHSVLPPRIILYLENLWLMVEEEGGDEREYRREVRTTFLHELGHYLGLDEDDLVDRGLE